MTGANLANGTYIEAVNYDALARPTETGLTRTIAKRALTGNTL
jgi:hypothetical protein